MDSDSDREIDPEPVYTISELHDHCVDREMPLPIVKVKKCSEGYVARCCVATLSCRAWADSKEQARHKAATTMLSMIAVPTHGHFSRKKPKFMPLAKRHNYFKNFPQALKAAAFEVIYRPQKYTSLKEQVMSLLDALELESTTGVLYTVPGKEPLLKLELQCGVDCRFLGTEKELYGEILEYFRIMLV
ncbi:uncharacterized protein LOC110180358 [Drosophila serrata]|uniref:uncharacterized protein LOC110180358 n=1 Tax=Drosophila serrata TaxID=7274 RepID=UPI000A1D3135|nr:uncharacterized protein LOC110180358 [Drosophila serrata]